MPRPFNIHQDFPSPTTDRVYGMNINRPPVPENVHGVRVEREEADWARNKPLNVDYNQLERETVANRQRVGWVPHKGGVGYIPASVAEMQGYFYNPKKRKSYFETDPEFKTFFPNDPYYAGLASLKEWQRSGGDIYDETHAMPYDYWGSYKPSTQNISMNLGEDLGRRHQKYYGAYPDASRRGYRDTLLHEMMHHWTGQPGASGESPEAMLKSLRGPEHSDIITEGQAMWNPLYEENYNTDRLANIYDMDEVQDFMKMHRLGKREYQGYNTGGLASLML
jgi:hypothetical protein